MTDPVSAFLDHMRAVDCAPDDPGVVVPDDKRRRYRLEGDKPRTQNGCYSLRVEADGFAFGWCKNWREGVTHPWHLKAARKVTAPEREAWKARAVLARQARDAADKAAHDEAAARAKALWSRCAKSGEAGYLDRKGCQLHGARVSKGAVVVPVYGEGGIVSLQFIGPDGSKRFLRDSQLAGGYFPIASRGESVERLAICEGFATGAALRDALGWPVVCAFNAGNLVPVAKAMRAKYPEARIVIAADNDQWTEIAGKPANPGLDWARQAAVAIGGAQVIAPQVPHDDPERRTDWDDVWRTDGPEAVKAAFEAPVFEAPDMMEGDWEPDYGLDDAPPGEPQIQEEVRPLGHNDGVYYFLPRQIGQVRAFTPTSLASVQNLVTMAPYAMWKRHFGGEDVSDRKLAGLASVALIEICNAMGVFDPDRIRGIGAWMEGGRVVFNTGGRIVSDRSVTDIRQYKPRSNCLYPADVDVFDEIPEPMDDREAWGILKSCTALRWNDPLSGYYLAGWLVTSILGGIIRWRPHLHISGDRGSGKSTIIERLIKPLLQGLAVEADGGSTEAGIRAAIINSSRPVVMDEAEGHTKQARDKIAAVMDLVRASSSGGKIRNANNEYRCRASFLMVGINPQIRTEADKSRIVILHLKSDTREGARDRYDDWLRAVSAVTSEGAAGRLVARLIECAGHMAETVQVVARAIRQMGVEARYADQHGALLAGVWLLCKARAPDEAEAVAFLERIGLTAEVGQNRDEATGESWRVLSEILTADHAYDAMGVARRSTVAALVEAARDGEEPHRSQAVAALSDLGMEVEGDWLRVASSSPKLAKLLRDTPWAGDGWNRHLLTLPGAQEGKRRSFRGLSRRRTVEVPLGLILDRDDEAPAPAYEEDIPW
jgi:putative DNA primase/helicase